MLQQAVGIITPSSLGGGQYSLQLYFQLSAQAKFLRVDDIIEDSAANQYKIVSWTGSPSDFGSGGTLTVDYVTSDEAPIADSGFNSLAFTPGQLDARPVMKTPGTVFNINFYSGQNYEYQLSGSWTQGSESAKAIVGDRIVDSTGKEYEITYLDAGDRFSVPFRMKEVEPIGITPTSGSATLYRGTSNYKFFQGSELTDPARTVIFNRDKFIIDQQLGTSGSGTDEVIAGTFTNDSGGNFTILTPIRQDASGNLDTIDVSVEGQVFNILGITAEAINDGVAGSVVLAGLIKNISTSFDLGDTIYLSKTGTLINDVPEIGTASFEEGDFVVFIGQITKNADTLSNKDLLVDIQIRGQL